MFWKLYVALGLVTVSSQVAMAQASSGNVLTGDAKAQVVRQYSGPEALPRPDRVVIHEFAVPDDAVKTDKSIAGRLHRDVEARHGVDEDSSPEELAQQVQAAFTKTLAEELKKVNMPVAGPSAKGTSAAASIPSGSELIIDGQFAAINEGDETKRILIGFGRGASDIKTHVTVSALVHGVPRVVLEFNLNSQSGKKPGAVAGAGMGSVAAGAAAGGVSDKKSKVESDATRMAKLVAKQLEAFMAGQNWIPNAAAESAHASAAAR